MQFRLLHMDTNTANLKPWHTEQVYSDIDDLFHWDPDTAAWFQRNPHASYLQYDHGNGLHWKYERVE